MLEPVRAPVGETTALARYTPAQRQFVAGQLSGETKRAYASDLRHFTHWLATTHGRGLFDDVTRETLRQYRDWMKQEGQEGRGYAHATIRRHFSCLKQFYAHALVEGLVTRNPVELVKTFRVSDVSPRNPLADAQVRRLLAHPRRETLLGARDYAVLTIMLYLGLRRSEVASLSCDAVQQEREYLTLRVHGKGDKPRKLPLPPQVLEALGAYLALDGRADALGVSSSALFHPLRNRRGDQSLTGHLTTNAIWLIVTQHAHAVGIEPIDAHTLRMTAATAAIEAGADLVAVKEMLGHSDIKTTQRYVKRRNELVDSAVWRVHY